MNIKIETFMVGVAASVLVSVIYGLILAQREDRIREKLAQASRGWARRRYIWAFIGAVRGKAAVNDTSILTHSAVASLLGVSILVYLQSQWLDIRMDATEQAIERHTTTVNGGSSMKASGGYE